MNTLHLREARRGWSNAWPAPVRWALQWLLRSCRTWHVGPSGGPSPTVRVCLTVHEATSGDAHASKVLIALLEHLAGTQQFRISWHLGRSHATVEALQGCVPISGETRPTSSWAFAQADEGHTSQPMKTAYLCRSQHVESHSWLAKDKTGCVVLQRMLDIAAVELQSCLPLELRGKVFLGSDCSLARECSSPVH